MKGMKWVIALNAALVGIVILVGFMFAYSWIRGAIRPAPVAAVEKAEPRLPLEVPPVCTCGYDFRTGNLLMQVSNVLDKPLSYAARSRSELGPYVEFHMNGDWVPWWTNRCNSGGVDSKSFVIQPGESVTFPASTSGMLHPTRYYRTFSTPDGRMSEMLLGEYWP